MPPPPNIQAVFARPVRLYRDAQIEKLPPSKYIFDKLLNCLQNTRNRQT